MIIFKEKLIRSEIQRIRMPRGSKLLDIQIQDSEIMLWFLCDPNEECVNRVIQIIGTGNRIIADAGEYVATVVDGQFVWHFFDKGEINA